MWNDRFSSLSGDPFDPSAGFLFPAPEGTSLSYLPHLLDAQAFIPPTERAEAAGFAFPGDNDAIRAEVVRRLNAAPGYRKLFARVFPRGATRGADHLRDGRARDRRVRVLAHVRERARSTATRAASANALDRPGEAGRAALLRRGRLRAAATRSPGRRTRCSATSAITCIGVPQLVPDHDERPLRRAGRERGLRTRAVHRRPRRPLRVPHLAASQRRAPARVHARRRLHHPRGAIRHHLDVVASASPTTRRRKASTPT